MQLSCNAQRRAIRPSAYPQGLEKNTTSSASALRELTQKRDTAPNFQAGIVAMKTKKIRVLLTQSPRSIYNTRAARRDLLQRRGAELALHEQVATGLGLHEAGASRILLLEEASVLT